MWLRFSCVFSFILLAGCLDATAEADDEKVEKVCHPVDYTLEQKEVNGFSLRSLKTGSNEIQYHIFVKETGCSFLMPKMTSEHSIYTSLTTIGLMTIPPRLIEVRELKVFDFLFDQELQARLVVEQSEIQCSGLGAEDCSALLSRFFTRRSAVFDLRSDDLNLTVELFQSRAFIRGKEVD